MTGLTNIHNLMNGLALSLARTLIGFSKDSMALIGLTLACLVIAFSARPDLRGLGEIWLADWLAQRQFATIGMTADPIATERTSAMDPRDLPAGQAQMAQWISKKYRVAPEAVAAVVAEAHEIGLRTRLEPTLILAIAAIESGFNPFSQSPNGAQGLMQVMTRVHTDKFQHFGGALAAFDPIANLRVGVKVLQECIARAGSVEGGLRCYVGAASIDDGGYADKVLAEQARLELVARPTGKRPLR